MEFTPIIIKLLIYVTLILFALAVSLVSAISIGAIPAICGIFCKKKTLGWIGFAACSVLAMVVGAIPAQIASIIFTVLIVKDSQN